MEGGYQQRPWLGLYQPGKPADITPACDDALAMWRGGAGSGAAAGQPFLYYFDTPVTGAAVDADSDALAAALAARGLGQGDRLALFLQNVPQFVIALLAAWKLGAIAVPVNPMLKERELRYVLADSGAKAIISLQDLWQATAAQAVAGTEVAVAITTSPLDYLAGEATPPPVLAGVARTATPGAADLGELLREHAGERPDPVTLGPGGVALLTYTSGTTGDPKGAMNTHGNVVFNACTFRDWMSLTPRDVVLGGAPLFHITGLIAHIAVGMLVPMPIVLGYRFEPGHDHPAGRTAPLHVHRDGHHRVHGAGQRSRGGRRRPVVADQGVQRRRTDRAEHRRAVRARGRPLHPQRLRAHRDHLAVARGAIRPPCPGGSGKRRVVRRGARLQHGRPYPWRGRAGAAARWDRRDRHQGPDGGARLLEPAGRHRADATRRRTAHRRRRLHGRATAGSTWSTGRRT